MQIKDNTSIIIGIIPEREIWTKRQGHCRHQVAKSSVSSNNNNSGKSRQQALLIHRSRSTTPMLVVLLLVLFQIIPSSYGWILNTNNNNIHHRKRSCNSNTIQHRNNIFLPSLLLLSSSSCVKVQQYNVDDSTTSPTIPSSTATTNDRDELVRNVVQMARSIGPVGVLRSQDEQDEIFKAVEVLEQYSDINPAYIPLKGIHNLIYSAAPGGSSGKLGPFVGSVTQQFVNDVQFINAVTFGPLRIALQAQRQVKNSNTIKVTFQQTSVSLFGTTLIEKETKGGGIWNYIFCGTIQDTDGSTILVRIMKTPSLFIIIQPVETATTS